MKLITYVLSTLIVLGRELSSINFDEKTAGKVVFIKFFVPDDVECMEIAPAWDRLVKTFEKSTNALIAEVNCHGAGENLCKHLSIEQYPALKYGDSKDLKDYTDAYDYQSLMKFALKNVGSICGPDNLELCDADQKKKIITMQSQGLAKLEENMSRLHDLVESTQAKYEEEVDKLYQKAEQKYFELEREMEKILEDLRDKNDFNMMKTVHAHLVNNDPHINW